MLHIDIFMSFVGKEWICIFLGLTQSVVAQECLYKLSYWMDSIVGGDGDCNCGVRMFVYILLFSKCHIYMSASIWNYFLNKPVK